MFSKNFFVFAAASGAVCGAAGSSSAASSEQSPGSLTSRTTSSSEGGKTITHLENKKNYTSCGQRTVEDLIGLLDSPDGEKWDLMESVLEDYVMVLAQKHDEHLEHLKSIDPNSEDVAKWAPGKSILEDFIEENYMRAGDEVVDEGILNETESWWLLRAVMKFLGKSSGNKRDRTESDASTSSEDDFLSEWVEVASTSASSSEEHCPDEVKVGALIEKCRRMQISETDKEELIKTLSSIKKNHVDAASKKNSCTAIMPLTRARSASSSSSSTDNLNEHEIHETMKSVQPKRHKEKKVRHLEKTKPKSASERLLALIGGWHRNMEKIDEKTGEPERVLVMDRDTAMKILKVVSIGCRNGVRKNLINLTCNLLTMRAMEPDKKGPEILKAGLDELLMPYVGSSLAAPTRVKGSGLLFTGGVPLEEKDKEQTKWLDEQITMHREKFFEELHEAEEKKKTRTISSLSSVTRSISSLFFSNSKREEDKNYKNKYDKEILILENDAQEEKVTPHFLASVRERIGRKIDSVLHVLKRDFSKEKMKERIRKQGEKCGYLGVYFIRDAEKAPVYAACRESVTLHASSRLATRDGSTPAASVSQTIKPRSYLTALAMQEVRWFFRIQMFFSVLSFGGHLFHHLNGDGTMWDCAHEVRCVVQFLTFWQTSKYVCNFFEAWSKTNKPEGFVKSSIRAFESLMPFVDLERPYIYWRDLILPYIDFRKTIIGEQDDKEKSEMSGPSASVTDEDGILTWGQNTLSAMGGSILLALLANLMMEVLPLLKHAESNDWISHRSGDDSIVALSWDLTRDLVWYVALWSLYVAQHLPPYFRTQATLKHAAARGTEILKAEPTMHTRATSATTTMIQDGNEQGQEQPTVPRRRICFPAP